MDNVPWLTGLLTHMLISYAEEQCGGENKINYRSVLSSVAGYEKTANSRVLLKDIHRWFPQPVFRELVRQCELLSGRKDVAYQAALHYFSSNKASSLLQIIARTIQDVRMAFSCSSLWAPAYSSMLRVFSFEKVGWDRERGMVARFDPSSKPSVATIGVLRGNVEGFLHMYGEVAAAQCLEEISQLRLEDLLEEFPNYNLVEEGEKIFIQDSKSEEPIVEAKVVYLKCEEVMGPPASLVSEEMLPLQSLDGGRVIVLTTEEEEDPHQQNETNRAYRIVKGGSLFASPLSYFLPPGALYNAPYSRFRCIWRGPEEKDSVDKPSKESIPLSRLLLHHLRDVRENQERFLAETQESFRLRKEARPAYPFGIISQSRRMELVFEFIHALSQVDSTVLIYGETGTGKELVARAIHDAGHRTNKPFLAVNCGALSESLLESELFGHEKGAFTGAAFRKKGRFELAHQGTLFLDEIGEISPAMQVKLLRVLQEHEFERVGGGETIQVDIRIIGATNRDLLSLVSVGRFRQDLYYRLNVIQILLPPLRERKEDIPLLIQHFLKKSSGQMNKWISGITSDVMKVLMEYHWPGNIRELQNVIERGVVLAAHRGWIGAELLPSELTEGRVRRKITIEDRLGGFQWHEIEEWLRKEGSLDSLLDRIQWSIVQKAVEQHQGNKTQAAAALKRTYRWLRKFEIKARDLDTPKNLG